MCGDFPVNLSNVFSNVTFEKSRSRTCRWILSRFSSSDKCDYFHDFHPSRRFTQSRDTSRAIDHTREASVSRPACAPLPKLSEKQTYRGTKDFWETLRILCSGVAEDLPNVLRPRLPLWGSEVGFGAWSSKKGLRGTGKVKSAATTANNARRKRATVRSHVSFDHFHPRRPTRIRRYKGTKPSPIPVSLFALFLRSFPFLYIRFSFDLLFSLSRCFSWRTLAARTQICSGAQTNGKSSHVGSTHGRFFNLRWKIRQNFAILRIFVILISPVSII